MAHNLREQSQWRKEKAPIVRQYVGDHNKLMSEIAGRGFLNLPGYAYDLENELELRLKLGLSEINYKILSETIERELKQQGIDYNLAYKTAALAWEVEKQGLIAAWDSELAGIKQGMATEEEIKDRLAIEVKTRQTTLIAAKTAIEEEMEGYRLTLAGLDDDTAAYEVSLAQAKLLTAQKKLELIPILQEICTKEEALLELEEDKAAEMTTLLNEKREVAGKRAGLIPWYLELANLNETYASLIPGQIAIEEQIADEKVAQANALIEKEENKLSELNINIDTAEKEVEISAAKRALQVEQFDNQQTLVGKELTNENAYQNEIAAKHGVLLSEERDTLTYVLDKKGETNDIQNDTKLSSVQATTEAQIAAGNSSAAASAYAERKSSEIRAAGEITAALTHLIG